MLPDRECVGHATLDSWGVTAAAIWRSDRDDGLGEQSPQAVQAVAIVARGNA